MRVSALFHSGLANEESRVSALVRKSVRTIDLVIYRVEVEIKRFHKLSRL
jgi:hypothetical protein